MAVTAARETVACPITAGNLDRGDTRIRGEHISTAEPRRRPGPADRPDCVDRTDSVDLSKPSAVLIEHVRHPLGDVSQVGVHRSQIANQIFGEFLTHPFSGR